MSGFAWRIHQGVAQKLPIAQAFDVPCDFVWVHLNTNTAEAQDWLANTAGLPDYVVEALTASETRPRCDALGDGAYINLRGRSSEVMSMSDPLASVRIYATAGRVISVTRKSMIAMEQVVAAVRGGEVMDPGDLIAEFAIAITTELDPEVADLGDLLDDCETDLDADKVFELRSNVTRIRATAIGYRRFLAPQRAAIEKLAALPAPWLQDDDRIHLSSAADRAARMAEELESIRERAALMHEQLTDLRAEQIDQRTLVISIVAMIFLPLTFVTGLLGMNVAGIPFAHQPWAFDGVVLLCAVVAVAITAYFVRRRWFPG